MEQTSCWMWTKRKHNLTSSLLRPASSYDDSWEEQAFAEDAAGPLGGCIWPPRSYSCSFCRREFRSAQALGGHMNVHRRDRARLKLSPVPSDHHNEVLQPHNQDHDHNLFQNPYTSLGFQYPSNQICALVYSPNPNSDPSVVASQSSPSDKVSTKPSQANCDIKNFFPLYSSSTVKEEVDKKSCRSSPPPQPKSSSGRCCHISNPRIKQDTNCRILESGCIDKLDYVKTDLSVSLNLVVRRTRPTISDDDDEEEESHCSKRMRTGVISKKSTLVERHHVQSEVTETNPCPIDQELDLELRLGDRPQLK